MSDRNVIAYIALGSNLGEREALIERAFEALDGIPSTRLLRRSPVVETEPVGPPGQCRYLNAVAEIETSLGPRALLEALLGIERAQGRDRSDGERWGPRTLDLDILLYADRVIAEPGLIIPHPRMHEREFVLEPLAAIAPDARHPMLRQSARWLLDSLRERQ